MHKTIKAITLTGALLALSAVAPNAVACSVPGITSWKAPVIMPPGFGPLAGTSVKPSTGTSIVGLWYITFYSGPYVVDQGFDVWHSDGTEVLNDFTDPIEDNVCLGVWSQSGQTIKLKHPSWTFDTTGTLTGTALIGETITLDAGGNSFSGSYTINLYDTAGNPTGKYQGVVKATRVMPD